MKDSTSSADGLPNELNKGVFLLLLLSSFSTHTKLALFIDLQAKTGENGHVLLIFLYFNIQEIHLLYIDPMGRKTHAAFVAKCHLVRRATQGHRNTCTDKQLFVKVLCIILMALNVTFKEIFA